MPESPLPSRPPTSARVPLAYVVGAVVGGIVADHLIGITAEHWWLVSAVVWCAWVWLIARAGVGVAQVGLLIAVATTAGCWHSLHWNRFDVFEVGRFASEIRKPVCVEVVARGSPRIIPAPAYNPMRALPTGDRSRLDVDLLRIRDGTKWIPTGGRTTLLVDGHVLGVHAGDRLRVFARLSSTTPAMNPGEFDFALHARRDQQLSLLQTSYPDAVERLSEHRSLQPAAAIDHLRVRGNEQLWSELSHDQSGLAAAIMLGAREQLGRERNEAFFQTGTVHLMAISGLHVGLLALGLALLLRILMVPEQRALVLVAIASMVYVFVTDARPPAVRALIIVLVLCIGRALGRQTNAWNTLALAGIIVLVINPTEVFRTGTQLSFLAVAMLIWAGTAMLNRPQPSPLARLIADARPWWHKFAAWTTTWFGRTVLLTAAVWLVALPLVMTRFHLVPTVGLFLGPVLAIPVAVALASGFLLLVFGWLWKPLAVCFAFVCDTMLAFIQWAVRGTHDTPVSHAWVTGPAEWWLVGFYGLLALFLALGHRRPRG
ncbi:MAG: ComEC family competence protein [Pirellulales bacterium]|nr:ComEC family competence protein [Pirellulales bacterium]